MATKRTTGTQFKSDVSTERVQQFRKRKRNVSETPPESESEQNPLPLVEVTDEAALAAWDALEAPQDGVRKRFRCLDRRVVADARKVFEFEVCKELVEAVRPVLRKDWVAFLP